MGLARDTLDALGRGLGRAHVRLLCRRALHPETPARVRRKLLELLALPAPLAPQTRRTTAILGGVRTEWLRTPQSESHRHILYLHGGGFVAGSPRTHRAHASWLAHLSRSVVAVPDYRLAPEHRYPALMLDARAAYDQLLEQGVDPAHLIVAGDSAGGFMTLQLLNALRDEGRPLPAAAVLISPLLDALHLDGSSYETRAERDPWLSRDTVDRLIDVMMGPGVPRPRSLDGLDASMAGLPPLWVEVGDHEVLLSDSVRLASRAKSDGVDAHVQITPGMWHVFPMFAIAVREAREAQQRIATFIRKHT